MGRMGTGPCEAGGGRMRLGGGSRWGDGGGSRVNEISGGSFHGPVVQAQHVDTVNLPARQAGWDHLFAALAGAGFVALGVFLGAGGGGARLGVGARWTAAAGCAAVAV